MFSVDDVDMRKLEADLRENHQVHVKYRKVEHIAGLRGSPHIYMLKSDLDAFVNSLRKALQ